MTMLHDLLLIASLVLGLGVVLCLLNLFLDDRPWGWWLPVLAILLLVMVLTLSARGAETYTVTVGTPPNLWQTANAVAVVPNHEPHCTLIRYVGDYKGQKSTNEFHAWYVPVTVQTNKSK